MKTELAVTRAFTDQCIELHNQGKLDGGMASMCKYWITDMQNRITYEGVQLHGGWGYMWEYPICRAYVDAKVSISFFLYSWFIFLDTESELFCQHTIQILNLLLLSHRTRS